MEIQDLIRSFAYNSVKLADPSPSMTLAQVRDFYAMTYPELTSAEIEGPAAVGNTQVFTFRRAVGTKGINPAEMGLHALPPAAPPQLPAGVKVQVSRYEVTLAGLRRLDVPASQRPIVPMKKIVDDLMQLAKIGWFSTEKFTEGRIRSAQHAFNTNLSYKPTAKQAHFFDQLHSRHCRRDGPTT